MNRLSGSASPYLLQHAHNPVDWFPWGEEALALARREDKPILVSVGYSACHWCHVMERESFEDKATAGMMNELYVCIKIDREERPDLDHFFMDALQSMSGGGGWPLHVFLTPEGRPFYGGTYFPPVRIPGRVSWKEVLYGVHRAFREQREQIEGQAEELVGHLARTNRFGINPAIIEGNESAFFTPGQLADACKNILSQADQAWGGFGSAPKFPQTFTIRFLLRHYYVTGNRLALDQALLSLDKMIMGGIHDHVGGGFCRYSTDTEWLAPHFEKMLYDNALLVPVLCEAWQMSGLERYRSAVEGILAFVQRELMDAQGGFYSALDADSEGVEGKFYTWSRAEVEAVLEQELGAEGVQEFCRVYDITAAGNWEHTNIPRLLDWPEPEQHKRLQKGLELLAKRRDMRVRPGLDHKMLLGWNALMNRAFTMASMVFGNEDYGAVAERNLAFLWKHFVEEGGGRTRHVISRLPGDEKLHIAEIPAFLDDLSALILALLDMGELTGENDYLIKAKKVLEEVFRHFTDEEGLFFYFSGDDQGDVLVRKKEIYDGALPSGNALMANVLHRMGILFEQAEWRGQARRMVASMGSMAVKYPTSFGVWLDRMQEMYFGTREVVIVGSGAGEMASVVHKMFVPYKVLQFSEDKDEGWPLLRDRFGKDGRLRSYICKDFFCGEPVFDAVGLAEAIGGEGYPKC